ncbi:hypothetical protein IQ07DRAFT_586679 [Pyrenochaeta sp. DS3sAY3a]|nr:hypothetical protein IQ07DRAFT_586679 [Pyrenochaeta sp. DS3sAY3a]
MRRQSSSNEGADTNIVDWGGATDSSDPMNWPDAKQKLTKLVMLRRPTNMFPIP